METTFKTWFTEQYTEDEMRDIAEHGCASCAPHGMVYYYETKDLYSRFADSIHEIVGEYVASCGEMPPSLLDSLDSATQFQNTMVWMAAELLAYDLASHLID